MRAVVYIKDKNLHTGFASIKEHLIKAYWLGLVESIDLYDEHRVFLESYYGEGLDIFMTSLLTRYTDGGARYFLAKRWLNTKD